MIQKDVDTKNWIVDTAKLVNYRKSTWDDDQFFETEDEQYGIYVYNINEWTMGAYSAEFAIYLNKKNSESPINFKFNTVAFNFKTCFEYAKLSNCIILKKQFYEKELCYPFLLIKPNNKKFALIEWNFTSIYFKFIEVEKNILQLKIESENEVKRLKLEERENEIFELEKLKWFEIGELMDSPKIYSEMIMK